MTSILDINIERIKKEKIVICSFYEIYILICPKCLRLSKLNL